jgi:hypothetical protein
MQSENDQGRPSTDFATAKSDIADRLQREKQSAAELFHDARDEAAGKAGDYAAQAGQALSGQAEQTQRDIGSSLAALGGALRAASDHLANNDQDAASKFALDAAGGLERLSSSLRQKPFGQVLEDVQAFGRQNPGMLLAGSVLAGLALGRFVKASSPSDGSRVSSPSKSDGGSWSEGGSSDPIEALPGGDHSNADLPGLNTELGK